MTPRCMFEACCPTFLFAATPAGRKERRSDLLDTAKAHVHFCMQVLFDLGLSCKALHRILSEDEESEIWANAW